MMIAKNSSIARGYKRVRHADGHCKHCPCHSRLPSSSQNPIPDESIYARSGGKVSLVLLLVMLPITSKEPLAWATGARVDESTMVLGKGLVELSMSEAFILARASAWAEA